MSSITPKARSSTCQRIMQNTLLVRVKLKIPSHSLTFSMDTHTHTHTHLLFLFFSPPSSFFSLWVFFFFIKEEQEERCGHCVEDTEPGIPPCREQNRANQQEPISKLLRFNHGSSPFLCGCLCGGWNSGSFTGSLQCLPRALFWQQSHHG